MARLGLRIPLRSGSNGGLLSCDTEIEHIEQSIRLIICTRLGSRPLEPEFGCRIHELAFRPLTPRVRALAVFFVEFALQRWEPRIILDEVKLSAYGDVQDGPSTSDIGIESSPTLDYGQVRLVVNYKHKHRMTTSANNSSISFLIENGLVNSTY